MRVTIGLPVFNGDRYLAELLDSCLAQTYSDFELIISDNASTDGTEAICRSYAERDSRIRYYRNDKNLGIAPNFNRAFALSDTEYFKWAPYDDVIAPEFLARCVHILDTHPSHVVCYSRAVIIDEDSEYVVDYDPGPATDPARAAARFRNLMLHPEYAIQQMGLIRSDALKRTAMHGSFPSSDEILLAQLALLGPFFEIPDRLYRYRRHSEQTTKDPNRRNRTALFDTALEGRIVLPTWRYFLGAMGAIRRSEIPLAARVCCTLTMLRWVLVEAHWRAMGKDLMIAARQIAVRTRDEAAGTRDPSSALSRR